MEGLKQEAMTVRVNFKRTNKKQTVEPHKTPMKTNKFLCLIAVTCLLHAAAVEAKPKIVILATGGTIAGAQASSTQVGYKSGSLPVTEAVAEQFLLYLMKFGFAVRAVGGIA